MLSLSLRAEVIELTKPVKVKNPDILASANQQMWDAIYSEDEGYEYKMLEDAKNIYIYTIYKDAQGETEKLLMSSSVRSGGFGWHYGYQEGWSNCTIELIKNDNGTWKDADGYADCETELDRD